MNAYEHKKDTLYVEEKDTLIILSLSKPKYLDSYYDPKTHDWIERYNLNQIEVCYRTDDNEGWGIGSNEFISTADIKSLADGIRSVIHHKSTDFYYSCQDDLFRIHLCYYSNTDLYSVTFAFLETLLREYHITVTKNDLTFSALQQYIQPFFVWEKNFPVV